MPSEQELASALTLEELGTVSSPLAGFVADGYIAGFQGPGGLFAVYEVRGPLELAPTIALCTMRERPTLIHPEEGSFWAKDDALAVAHALSRGLVRMTQRGTTFVVADADVDTASDAVEATDTGHRERAIASTIRAGATVRDLEVSVAQDGIRVVGELDDEQELALVQAIVDGLPPSERVLNRVVIAWQASDDSVEEKVHAGLVLGEQLRRKRAYAEAETAVRAALTLLEDSIGTHHHSLATPLFILARLLEEGAVMVPEWRGADVEAMYRRVTVLLRRAPTPERGAWFDTWAAIARLLAARGRAEEAAAARVEAYKELRRLGPPTAIVHEGDQLRVTIDHRGLVWFSNRHTKNTLFVLPARCILDVALARRGPAPPLLSLRGCFKHSSTSDAEDHHQRVIGPPCSAAELEALDANLRARLGLPVEILDVTEADLIRHPERFHGMHLRVTGTLHEGYEASSFAGASFTMPSRNALPPREGMAGRRWRVTTTGIWTTSYRQTAYAKRRDDSPFDFDAYEMSILERLPEERVRWAKRGEPFDETERRGLIERFGRAQRHEYLLGLGVAPEDPADTRTLDEVRREMSVVSKAYVEAVPIVRLSRCPMTDRIFESSFDPFDVDGLWWAYDYDYRPYVEPPPTLFAWTGALKLGGPVPTWCMKAMVGPEVPFVVPRVLSHASMKAVISSVKVGAHTGYVIAYFSRELPEIERIDDWGIRCHTLPNPRGGLMSAHATQDDAEKDFDLGPWLERGSLYWIEPGNPRLLLRKGVVGCPYLNLPGERRRCYIESGDTWLAR